MSIKTHTHPSLHLLSNALLFLLLFGFSLPAAALTDMPGQKQAV